MTSELHSVLLSWAHFVANDADRPLRTRDLQLALVAARHCAVPVDLYFDTKPKEMRAGRGFGKEPEHRAMLQAIREITCPAVIDWILDRFTQRNGIRHSAAGLQDDGNAVWLLECEDSPLYATPESIARLVEVLSIGAQPDGPREFSANAADYLRLLAFMLRDGSWVSDLGAFSNRHPLIIETAWSAAVRVEAQFRALDSFRALRRKLLAAGVSANLLPLPAWWVEEPAIPREPGVDDPEAVTQ